MLKQRRVPIPFIQEKIKYQKTHPKAEEPFKEEQSDVRYNLTLISRTENRAEDDTGEVNDFGTGLNIHVPQGYYFEMVAHPHLHKHGYMLASGVQIIDDTHTGEITVSLYKYKDAEDLELPFQAVQLILRQAVYAHLAVVKNTVPKDDYPQHSFSGGYTPQGYEQSQNFYQNQPQQASSSRRSGRSSRNHMF